MAARRANTDHRGEAYGGFLHGGRVPCWGRKRGRPHRSHYRVEGRTRRPGVRGRPAEPEGGAHEPPGGRRPEPAGEARHPHGQQGHDQGRHPGGPDVRTGAGRRRARGRRFGARGRYLRSAGRGPLHHRRRLHPLGRDRRQEDLRLELPGDEGVDRPRAQQRAVRPVGRRRRRPGPPPVRRRSRGVAGARDPTSQPAAWALDGARAVVTGASSGIGAGIAEAFAGAGATVLVTYRGNEGGAREVADGIAARGGRALVVRADLGARTGCAALVAEARDRLGGLDVWVNNAGADVLTGAAAGWDWERKLDLLLAVDLKGTIACSYAAAAVMREQPGGGVILNMSWDHVTSGMAGANPELFSAVKGGVLSFSRSLARALAPAVRVNVLCPGWIE